MKKYTIRHAGWKYVDKLQKQGRGEIKFFFRTHSENTKCEREWCTCNSTFEEWKKHKKGNK